jgi:formylglycine-generating enzyme required for sulfatase activity
MLFLAAALATASCQNADDRGRAAPRPETITTKAGATMVVVPGGWFEMGSSRGGPDEAPVHRVWVDAFLMDACEVTQEQYAAIAVINPSHFKGPDRPVEQISWSKAARFCNERSEAEGLQPCYDVETAQCNFEADGYRLPTEAEWEYACRAGAGAEDDRAREGQLPDHAWFSENAAKSTHPVAQKKPNPWGLYDMLGNVAEWCNDVYDENAYKTAPERDPRGPDKGRLRVLRGGAWNSKAQSCRPTSRAAESPGFQDACFAMDAIGFRCVRRVPPTQPAAPGNLAGH